jgi:hypothetical protein
MHDIERLTMTTSLVRHRVNPFLLNVDEIEIDTLAGER